MSLDQHDEITLTAAILRLLAALITTRRTSRR